METREGDVLLSFVIPVYNVEDYLPECLDSILECADRECEIILVDDGSTDGSGGICRAYADANPLIRMVRQENGGLSAARNRGLAMARGAYVAFVDSDDRLFPESVPELLAWAKSSEADLCFLQAVKLYPNGSMRDHGERISGSGLRSKGREEAVRYLASRPKYPGGAWAKLYRRAFLLQNDLHFPHDRRYSEDLGFVLDCVLRAESFDAIDVPCYQYRRKRHGSITDRVSFKSFYDLSCFLSESVQKLTDDGVPRDGVCRNAMGFVAYEYSILLYLLHLLPKEERQRAIPIVLQFRWTLSYARNWRGRLLDRLSGVLGLSLTGLMLKQYRKVFTG